MRAKGGFLALAALAVAPLAWAQVSESNKTWASGPVGYLLTKAERKAFEQITSDAEAAKFIELFWAKRDPDLETVVNEFKVDFEQRVAAADKQFSTEKVKGSMTDRGRTLVLLGRPAGIGGEPGKTAVGLEHGGDDEQGATEVWLYRKANLPVAIKTDEVRFYFVETRPGTGEYVLDRGHTLNVIGTKVLSETPEALIKNPKITEAPRVGLVRGSKGATSAELALLDGASKPWPEGASALVAESLVSSASQVLWIWIQVPESVPAADQAIGRARNAAGEEAGTFALPITPVGVTGARAYELSLPLEAGSWTVDLALVAAGTPVVVKTIEGTISPLPAEGTYFSPLYWGVNPVQASDAALGSPFNIGGWHLTPRPSNTYTLTEEVSYFLYILRPPRNPQGEAAVNVGIAVYSTDKPKQRAERAPEPAALSLVSEAADLWMVGQPFPVRIFKKAGDYRLEVTVVEATGGIKRVVEIPITVPGDAAAPAASPAPQGQ